MGSLLTIPCPDYGLIYQIEAILLLIVSNIAMFIGFIPLFNYFSWRWFNCWPNHHQWLQDKVDAVIERVFDQVLKKNDQDEYFVLDYKAPTNYTNLLFLTLVFVTVSAMVQFWDEFLYEESFDCITKIYTCCYGQIQNSTQYLDCSDTSYLEDNNITSVVCHRFVFRIGQAAGSAIGIIATNALVILVITWSLLKLSDGYKGKGSCRGVITVLIQSGSALITLSVTLLMCIYNVVSYPGSSLKKILQIYPIGILISIYILIFPWTKFEKIDKVTHTDNIP